MTPNDATLWSRWLDRRDPDSLAEIFSRHAGMVFATCRRILGNAADAEDAAQECFADLLRARGDVRASLAAWLHTIAVRRSLDLRKAERRRRERERAVAPAVASPEPQGECDELLALLDLAPFRADWNELGPALHSIEDLCRRTGAVPVAILHSSAHASAARRARGEHGLGLAIGIDAYEPGQGVVLCSVTAVRHGKTHRAGVFRIDASGVIRGHVRKLEDAEELFER